MIANQILQRIDAAAKAHTYPAGDLGIDQLKSRQSGLWYELLHIAAEVTKLRPSERETLARQIKSLLHP